MADKGASGSKVESVAATSAAVVALEEAYGPGIFVSAVGGLVTLYPAAPWISCRCASLQPVGYSAM